MTQLTVLVIASLLGLGLLGVAVVAAQEKELVIDWAHSHPVINNQPKGYSMKETADGYVFSIDSSGITYPIHVAKIEPRVSIQTTPAAGAQYHYEVTVHNDKRAKDAIRTVRFSYQRGTVPSKPQFFDGIAPAGWEEWSGYFTGELKPGATAVFSVTSTLGPDESVLVISGIDHQARQAEREAIVAQGGSLHFFRYMANALGNKEYRIYQMKVRGTLSPTVN